MKEAYFDILAESHLLTFYHVERHWLCWRVKRGSISMCHWCIFFKHQGLVIFIMILNPATATEKILLLKSRWGNFDPNKWLQRLPGEESCSLLLTDSLLERTSGRLWGEWPQLDLADGFFAICGWVSKWQGVARGMTHVTLYFLDTLNLSSAFWNELSINYCVMTWHHVVANSWGF